MRILALDHGSAKCGCAISDPTETIVSPLEPVAKPDSQSGQQALADLVASKEVDLILIGLPRLVGGDEGSQAASARAFAGRLGAKTGVQVEMLDERFTTRIAQASIAEGASSSEDSLAAAHLLEEFLAQRRSSNDPESGD